MATISGLTRVDERQIVQLDASGSTDADGDTLSFSWAQVSGDLIIDGPVDGPQLTITVPDLTADIMASFEVTVSDGSLRAGCAGCAF